MPDPIVPTPTASTVGETITIVEPAGGGAPLITETPAPVSPPPSARPSARGIGDTPEPTDTEGAEETGEDPSVSAVPPSTPPAVPPPPIRYRILHDRVSDYIKGEEVTLPDGVDVARLLSLGAIEAV